EKAASGEVVQVASPEKRPGNDVERRSGGRAAPKWVRIDASPCLGSRTERLGAPSLGERRQCVPGFVARSFRRPLSQSRERGIASGVRRVPSSPRPATFHVELGPTLPCMTAYRVSLLAAVEPR